MSIERKSFLISKLKQNLALVLGFLVLMGTLLYFLTSGDYEKSQGRQRMIQELKQEQEVAPEKNPAGLAVTPLVNEEYYYRLMSDLAAARDTVDILMFEIKMGKDPDNPANRLVEAAVAAKERGAAVRVRLEQSELDKALTRSNRQTAEFLKSRGIYPDFDLMNVETHAKAVLIDGRVLYVGNHNWSESSLFRNKEISLRVESARPISTMKRFFDKFDRWMEKWRRRGSAWGAENVRDVVFLNNEEYLSVLREAMGEAKKRVDIEMYLIRPGLDDGHPVRSIISDLGRARKRGVQVSVLMDSHFETDNKEAQKQLKEAGVWDVKFDGPEVTNHTKLVMIDDEVLIVGSQNWTLSALAASNETAIYVRDPRVIQELAKKRARLASRAGHGGPSVERDRDVGRSTEMPTPGGD